MYIFSQKHINKDILLMNRLKSPSLFTEIYWLLGCMFKGENVSSIKSSDIIKRLGASPPRVRECMTELRNMGVLKQIQRKKASPSDRFVYLPINEDYHFNHGEFFKVAKETMEKDSEVNIK